MTILSPEISFSVFSSYRKTKKPNGTERQWNGKTAIDSGEKKNESDKLKPSSDILLPSMKQGPNFKRSIKSADKLKGKVPGNFSW
jgi:hypothetical protein